MALESKAPPPAPAPPASASATKTELATALARSGLLAYGALVKPDWYSGGLLKAAHIKRLAAVLERVARGELKRVQIMMPPQHGKSNVTANLLMSWMLGCNPKLQLAYATYSEQLASDRGRDVRDLVLSPVFQALFPKALMAKDARGSTSFSMEAGGGARFIGCGQGLTGFTIDGIIIDDPFKDETEADSEVIRAKRWSWYNSVVMTRIKPNDFVIIINTRWHTDDLSGLTLKHHASQWEVVKFPALDIDDNSLWPEKFPSAFMRERRASTPARQWSALYQQEPVPAEGGLLDIRWLRPYLPEDVPARGWDSVVQSWDTAQKDKELSDPSVCTTWGIKGRSAYLLDVFRRRMGYPELRRAAIAQFEKWTPELVLIEDKSSGISLIQDLTAGANDDAGGARVPVLGVVPEGSKTMRASAVAPLIEGGQVLVPASAPWLVEYQAELGAFPLGSHDDQVDSTTQFLAWWKDRLRKTDLFAKAALGAPRRLRAMDDY